MYKKINKRLDHFSKKETEDTQQTIAMSGSKMITESKLIFRIITKLQKPESGFDQWTRSGQILSNT